MKQPGATQLIAIALILATGLGIVWGFGLGAVGSWLMPTRYVDYEDIVVDVDGTPYIKVRVRGDYNDLQFRTLDGKRVERSEADTFYPTTMNGPYRPPRIAEYPILWRSRIAGISGFERPPISWVVLRDGNRPGKAYFVGHDSKSNQLVGYIGRKGFRTSLPPADESFDLDDHTFQYDANAYATTGNMSEGYLGSSYNPPAAFDDENVLQPWLVYLCDRNAIQEINLRTRGVRMVKEFDDLVGIAVPGAAQFDKRRLRGQKPESRLLARTQDAFVLFDAFTGTEQRFTMPEELKDKSLGVNSVGADQLLLHVGRGRWERGNVVELLTINSAGEAQRKETVRLVGYTSYDSPYFALIPACLAPVLFGWIGMMFLIAPLAQLQEYQVTTFAEGVDVAWNAASMGLMLVLVYSILLTAIVYRWQKKYSRPNTPLWTTFVFLTTLPGFFAYWVMHRREPMGECVQCRATVPQDRDVCAHCAAPLPAPKLLGTEVFA